MFLSVNAYAEDALTVNSLLKEGFKITKEELVKNSDSLRSMKVLTLKKGNYSRIKPNKEDIIDINKAIKT